MYIASRARLSMRVIKFKTATTNMYGKCKCQSISAAAKVTITCCIYNRYINKEEHRKKDINQNLDNKCIH